MEPMLQLLGLSETENALYGALLDDPGVSATQLASRVGVSPRAARQGLERLESAGLISRTPDSRRVFVPAEPDVALEALVSRREEELRLVRLQASQLAERFAHRSRDDHAVTPVEFARGPEATRQRWVQVQMSARREIRLFDRPPYVHAAPIPNPEELALLSRGIRYRVIYDHESFDGPRGLDVALACVDAGEEARVMRAVPLKLVIADDRLGLAHNPHPERGADSFVIHRSGLLNALIVLFDTLWTQATPLEASRDSSREDQGLDDLDRRILTFLTAGAKDEAIARRLEVGVRTVRRRIQRMMRDLNAKTRFEAGVRASRRNWIK